MLNTRSKEDGLCHFGISKDFGDLGEDTIEDFLSFYFKVSKTDIQDMRDDEQSREEDVDFIVNKKDRKIKVEVKTDSYDKTGNIAFEYFSCLEYKTPGCMVKTKADYIFYYFPGGKKLLIFKTEEFREYVLNNIHQKKYRSRDVANKVWNGVFHSRCYLVPIKELLEIGPPVCKMIRVDSFN